MFISLCKAYFVCSFSEEINIITLYVTTVWNQFVPQLQVPVLFQNLHVNVLVLARLENTVNPRISPRISVHFILFVEELTLYNLINHDYCHSYQPKFKISSPPPPPFYGRVTRQFYFRPANSAQSLVIYIFTIKQTTTKGFY